MFTKGVEWVNKEFAVPITIPHPPVSEYLLIVSAD